MTRIRELSEEFRAEVVELFPGKDHVVVLQRTSGKRGERSLDIPVCQMITVPDGKIAEVRRFQADQYALDEFWA